MDLKQKQLIILDRDGVINFDSENFIRRVADFIYIPGSLDAMVQLYQAGKKLVVVTNQSGIARGYLDEAELEKMHHKLSQDMQSRQAAIERFYYCPHGPDDNCDCRKPKPAMVLDALRDLNCKPEDAVLIGDSIRDLQAAEQAGVDAILVKTGKGLKSAARLAEDAGSFNGPVCDHLAAAAQLLL